MPRLDPRLAREETDELPVIAIMEHVAKCSQRIPSTLWNAAALMQSTGPQKAASRNHDTQDDFNGAAWPPGGTRAE